ncbi:hypothetical protein A2U01_0114664, partial [Trifolium medium]|nr:hypothetical protein [Trifolium medium]
MFFKKCKVRHLLIFKKMRSNCISIRCFTKFGGTFLEHDSFFVKINSV